ncbi:MAG: hypothetical protein AB8G23_05900 [Myxococcota bacterium]
MFKNLTAVGSRYVREFSGGSWGGQSWPTLGRLFRPTESAPSVIAHAPTDVFFTPDSILQDPSGYQSWQCNGRRRYGTCSGVAWFHENYVATTNLLGNVIHTYRVSRPPGEGQGAVTLLQTLHNAPTIEKPENIAFSPDGRFAAITDMGPGDVKILSVDPETHLLSTSPIARVGGEDRTAHGVAFSKCGRFLAYTTIDKPGVIRLFRFEVEEEGVSIKIEPFQVFENSLHPLVPKGIDFSIRDDFVAVCYAPNTTQKSIRDRRGCLVTYAFSSQTGIDTKPISRSGRRHDLRFPEDVSLMRSDRNAILTQQGDDTARVVEIDPATGVIGRYVETLRNPDARLSFPHGVGVSADGRYAAVTSYGDDKFGIYRLVLPDL